LLLLAAGCGASGNVAAVTPVMADTKGTYRLASSSGTITAPNGSTRSFLSFSSGTLRLSDSSYNQVRGGLASQGSYTIGTSVNTILNSREGTFTLTPNGSPQPLSGSYQVTPDFVLTLNYNQSAQADQSLVTRSDTWVKQSDSPRF